LRSPTHSTDIKSARLKKVEHQMRGKLLAESLRMYKILSSQSGLNSSLCRFGTGWLRLLRGKEAGVGSRVIDREMCAEGAQSCTKDPADEDDDGYHRRRGLTWAVPFLRRLVVFARRASVCCRQVSRLIRRRAEITQPAQDCAQDAGIAQNARDGKVQGHANQNVS
jgi:hypothetical protein